MNPDDIEVRLASLELQMKAQDRIAFGFAIALEPDARLTLLKALQVMQLNAAAKDGLMVGQAMQHFIDRLLAVTAPGAPSALLTMATEAALYAKTREGQREALQSWLATGTQEEIADDIRGALPPAKPKRAAQAKRGKGGAS